MQVMFSNINLIFQAPATVEMDLLHVVFRVISIHTTTQYESQAMIISTHPVFTSRAAAWSSVTVSAAAV